VYLARPDRTSASTASAVFAALVLMAAPLFGAESGPAAPGRKAKAEPPYRISGLFALRFEHDDNIIHYSDEDLSEFTTLPNLGKFSITRAGDWIVRPRLDLNAETKALTGRKLEAQLRLTTWHYVENSVKSNESYQLRLKHPGFGGDNFQFTIYHAPAAYIRNFLDRPPYTSRVMPLQYTDFSYTSTSLTLAYWRRLSKKFDGRAEAKRSWRFFNQAFMENDTWEWRYLAALTWRAYGPLRITGAYDYTDAKGRGADSAGETVAASDDSDPSFQRDSYELTFDLGLKKTLLRVNQLSLSGAHQIFFFTSEKLLLDDPLHVGRKDKVYRVEGTWATLPVAGPVSLEGGYRYTKRTSTAPEVAVGEDIGEEKDYTDNRWWIGFEIPF
jgi:hypothetical protein